jgi:hypothetical protein
LQSVFWCITAEFDAKVFEHRGDRLPGEVRPHLDGLGTVRFALRRLEHGMHQSVEQLLRRVLFLAGIKAKDEMFPPALDEQQPGRFLLALLGCDGELLRTDNPGVPHGEIQQWLHDVVGVLLAHLAFSLN